MPSGNHDIKFAYPKANATMKRKKKKFLKELENQYGAINVTCHNTGIDKKTYYNYYNSDPEFARQCDEIQDMVKDKIAVSIHKKAIEGNDVVAQIWLSKARLGYRETKQIEHKGSLIPINVIPAWTENAQVLEEAETMEQLPEKTEDAEIIEEKIETKSS